MQLTEKANKSSKGYLALGGNLGDSRLLFRIALEHLRSLTATEITAVSALYRTRAVGCRHTPDFLNAVCAFSTNLPLRTWMDAVEHIERALGKLPKPKTAPRPIDLDLLFWNDERFEGSLEVPHPRWHTRAFVIRPLLDLTPFVEVGSAQGIERIYLTPLLEQVSSEKYPVRKVAW